jgi:hypothetical protein
MSISVSSIRNLIEYTNQIDPKSPFNDIRTTEIDVFLLWISIAKMI